MIAYEATIDFLGVLILLYGFVIIAENYIHSVIRHLQAQTIILSLLIGIVGFYLGMWELIALAIFTLIFRAWLIPEILLKDIKKERVWEHREFGAKAKSSLIAGIITAIVGIIAYLAIHNIIGTWKGMIPFILLLFGLLIIVMRRNALAQISGYIVEENALLYLGIVLYPIGFLLEVGILLDVIGAVLLGVILSAEKEYGPMEIEELSG